MEKLRHSLESELSMLRHALATLAYRAAKVLRDAPAAFADFSASPSSRTPRQILAHLVDLMNWAASIAEGREKWISTPVQVWEKEVVGFFEAVREFDERLCATTRADSTLKMLFQGPVADALTHVGQLAFLRRLAGAPVRGENYSRAKIAAGQVGPDQPPPVFEFD